MFFLGLNNFWAFWPCRTCFQWWKIAGEIQEILQAWIFGIKEVEILAKFEAYVLREFGSHDLKKKSLTWASRDSTAAFALQEIRVRVEWNEVDAEKCFHSPSTMSKVFLQQANVSEKWWWLKCRELGRSKKVRKLEKAFCQTSEDVPTSSSSFSLSLWRCWYLGGDKRKCFVMLVLILMKGFHLVKNFSTRRVMRNERHHDTTILS